MVKRYLKQRRRLNEINRKLEIEINSLYSNKHNHKIMREVYTYLNTLKFSINTTKEKNGKHLIVGKIGKLYSKIDAKQDNILNEQISKLPKKERTKENISKILNNL